MAFGYVGVEQHADDRRLHPGANHPVPAHGVDPTLDREPFEHGDPAPVVQARDQLTHPYPAELPVGELRRRILGGAFTGRHAEHGPLEHRGADRLPLGRTGGAAGQDLQRHTVFGVGVPTRRVAKLETGHRRHNRVRRRDRETGGPGR